MSGNEFRRTIKRLHKQGIITELYKRGFIHQDLMTDIDLTNRYLSTKTTYRSLSKDTSIALPLLHKRIKRCL